jgi:transposase
MDYYAGIDVSLEFSSVCVVDATGQIIREAKVASEPGALTPFLASLGLPLTRVGLEAGPLSQWLHAGLQTAGYDVVLLETRHVKAALSPMIVKTDRKDARGIAQLLRMGWFRPVHCKSPPAQEGRALLVARKQLQAKMRDVEFSLRGLLRAGGPANGIQQAASHHAGDRARRRSLPAADDGARRRSIDRGDVYLCRRSARAVLPLQGGGCAFWPHAEEVSVWRD